MQNEMEKGKESAPAAEKTQVSKLQPLLRQSIWFWPVRVVGSMFFAVALILVLAVFMALATFLGMQYGDDASSWVVYHANWFTTLCALLGLSVLFSALLRFPWRKYQIGFLVTHLGILVLLFGCWIDFRRGQSAYLSIAEGQTNSVAVCPGDVHFSLRISEGNAVSGTQPTASEGSAAGKEAKMLRKSIRFTPGPFSWRFYGKSLFSLGIGDSLPILPWSFPKCLLFRHHSGDVLYSENGCELVVLDYLFAGSPSGISASASSPASMPTGASASGKSASDTPAFEPAAAENFAWEAAKAGGNPPASAGMTKRQMKEKLASWPAWVKVRLTVDGEAQEFWLRQFDFFKPDGLEKNVPSEGERTLFQTETKSGKKVQLIFAQNTIDLNFALRLDRFHNRLDPGTSMASHYSSDVTLVEKSDSKKEIASNLEVMMNQPIDIFEPGTKQVWRLFQTSFNGPFLNENALGAEKDQFYVSTFTVHYSPGRCLLYLGCLFIVLGIGIMFSMKAYFFSR